MTFSSKKLYNGPFCPEQDGRVKACLQGIESSELCVLSVHCWSESHCALKSTECKAQWERGTKQQQDTKRKRWTYLKVEAHAWGGIYSTVVHSKLLHKKNTVLNQGFWETSTCKQDDTSAAMSCVLLV